jgi:hypothetical protein
MTAIALGAIGLILSVIQLRRAMRSTASDGAGANEHVSSP